VNTTLLFSKRAGLCNKDKIISNWVCVTSLVVIAINLTFISMKIDDVVYALSDIASVLTSLSI
jgi:hypothetical protein